MATATGFLNPKFLDLATGRLRGYKRGEHRHNHLLLAMTNPLPSIEVDLVDAERCAQEVFCVSNTAEEDSPFFDYRSLSVGDYVKVKIGDKVQWFECMSSGWKEIDIENRRYFDDLQADEQSACCEGQSDSGSEGAPSTSEDG